MTEVVEYEEIVRYPQAAMFILKRYRPEFRESFRVENTGPGGGPMRHEITQVDEVSARARGELERLHDGP